MWRPVRLRRPCPLFSSQKPFPLLSLSSSPSPFPSPSPSPTAFLSPISSTPFSRSSLSPFPLSTVHTASFSSSSPSSSKSFPTSSYEEEEEEEIEDENASSSSSSSPDETVGLQRHESTSTSDWVAGTLKSDTRHWQCKMSMKQEDQIKVFKHNLAQLAKGGPIELGWQTDPTCQIFANVDLSLEYIDAYGFDYDYTLAVYNRNVEEYIFQNAVNYLVEQKGYPVSIKKLLYNPYFPIRGIQFDHRTGYLLKLDQYGKIQPDTVYLGHRTVNVDELLKNYGGFVANAAYQEKNMRMLYDQFCLPEAALAADVIETLIVMKAEFNPRYVMGDIRQAINQLHASGMLHNTIKSAPDRFLKTNPGLGAYLNSLRQAGKKVFMLTNSPFSFVEAGMNFLLGDYCHQHHINHWTELFDVTITSSRKPDFFSTEDTFRKLDRRSGRLSFRHVESFKPGEVYSCGGLDEFMRITDLQGHRVLYVGDHVASDLLPTRPVKWRTAAIIKELDYEIRINTSPQHSAWLHQLLRLEDLIEWGQSLPEEESKKAVQALKLQRREKRRGLKNIFNQTFGSVFRTYTQRSKFYGQVCQYADIYTSSVMNFAEYPLNHCFYTRRAIFPHEPPYLYTHPAQIFGLKPGETVMGRGPSA